MIRFLPLLLLAGPLAAQEVLSLPEGCTATLTVQMQSCSLSHHFTCVGDAEGVQRRVDMDVDGMSYIGAIDFETQWIESMHLRAGHSERLEETPADRASFTELVETGADSYDFQTLSDEIGTSRYVGEDRLTGNTVVIDGVTLDETDYRIVGYDSAGNETWRASGTEYISRDFRMFLSGRSTYVVSGETFDTDDTPVEFILPGERGFLSLNPKYGCGAQMSSLETAAG